MAILYSLWGIPTNHIEERIVELNSFRKYLMSNRYLFRRPRYRKRTPKFHIYLDTQHDDAMTEAEFRFHFRVSRRHFSEIVELVEKHPAFGRRNSDSRGPFPKKPAYQMLILLKYYGTFGNQCSSVALATFFGVGCGVINTCRQNALEALLSLEDQTYFWPDAHDRRRIAARIKEAYLFPNCVGIIDGTLLPLAFKPSLHGENYSDRKKNYSLTMLVVCDDNSRILYYHLGWPGSVHDNRVWRNCKLNMRPTEFFSAKQYLLGDTAYTASNIMIPPFKAHGGLLTDNENAFNTLVSKVRVKSEHCIGILKGRFPFLRGIRMRLYDQKSMHNIINHIRGTVVLHNFLRNDEDWLEALVGEGGDDVEPESAAESYQPIFSRREELYFYLSELPDTAIN